MNTRYFETCNTLEEAKTLYKNFARAHHPDMGGDLRTMQEINAQYAEFCANFAKADGYQRQQDAHAEDRKSAADFHDLEEVAEMLRIKIEFALNLEGVEVELMGFWVWLTGNTKEHKNTIKAQYYVTSALDSSVVDDGANQLSVSYDYNFSKTTVVYVSYAKVSNDTAGTFSIGGNGHGETYTPIAGGEASGFSFGTRIAF